MSAAPPPRLPLGETALFLDFDGTLIEIAPRPEAVVVPADLPGLLEKLHDRMAGALAIVTGRRIAILDDLLHPAKLPTAGVHGEELRADPAGPIDVIGTPLPPELVAGIERVAAGARARWPGIHTENKGHSFTLHYRSAPEAELPLRAELERLPLGDDWYVMAGKRVFEVKSRHFNKGGAVRRFMAMPAFSGRKPVAVGDDTTDRDSIAAAADLGGSGIAVGGLRTDAAAWSLSDPGAVRDWLGGLLG
ncbi:MAG TPA: trehalose-phosphatase [Candidatus Binatia bacterium]|nr:trehalose-phosphatase [Candidatus Binatia bacterium]